MSDSSLRMSASSAMAAGCGGWRGSPTGKRRSYWDFGEGCKRGGNTRLQMKDAAEQTVDTLDDLMIEIVDKMNEK